MRRRASVIALLAGIACAQLPACTFEGPSGQPTIRELIALMPKYAVAQRLAEGKRPGAFDPNCYFAVLRHLSMEEGYVLDWVYAYDGVSGQPMLYARRSDESPAEDILDFKTARGYYNVLEHIIVDGTDAGYTELVILQTIGARFYLVGRAEQDQPPLPYCESGLLDSVVKCLGYMGSDTHRFLELPLADREPGVVLDDQHAQVWVFSYDYRAGRLLRLTYVFERHFPHTLVDSTSEIVVSHR
jgi:hypothetical protein